MAQPDKWHTHFLLSNFDEAEVQHLGMLELDGAQRPSLTNAVHPIFRQANWVQVRAAHYLQLRPILRLTSHFITNPHLLSYWHALMFGERIEIPRHVAVGPYYAHTLYSFHRIFDVTTNSYALSTLELERTQAALVDLAGAITFTINREPEKLNAVLSTGHDFTSTQTLPVDFGGTPSLIELDRSYVDAYARPDLSISQRLRLQFYIAASLLHELAHAVEMAVTPMLPRSPTQQGPNNGWEGYQYPEEPFFERDRLAECGFAWENAILGGRTQKLGSTVLRYGLVMEKWPDLEDPPEGFELPVRAKAKRWSTIYFVPMSYIQRLFANEFWTEEGIGRHGAGEVKPKKTLGWRRYNTGDVVSDSDEGISWGNSSRGRVPDVDGVIRVSVGSSSRLSSLDPSQFKEPFEFGDWTTAEGEAAEEDAEGDTLMG